jgi:hypothetical protein
MKKSGPGGFEPLGSLSTDLLFGWEVGAALETIAEVVGSNPTRSTFIILVSYGIELSSFLMSVEQKA